ncbi:MAG TPA: outer membrane beta-barrel domain-containing protein [Polyangiaceae bacterium]|nr:outer membrane beta-barrel domain-containing protein [Polyangiaceae bacterium]
MKRRFVSAVLAAAAAAGVLAAAPRRAEAQEIQLTGPLKGAPAVRHQRLYREGRFELDPVFSFTLLDEYRRTILVGPRLNYNIKDWIAIGGFFYYGAISTTTDLSDQINAKAPRDALTAINMNHAGGNCGTAQPCTAASFADQTAKMQWVGALQATFIPFRGKLAIFNKIFLDTDFYVAAGGAMVGIQERSNCGGSGQKTCADPASFALQSTNKIAPTFGVGFDFFGGNWWSLNVEYRALPFSWNRSGFDSRGSGTNGNFPDGQVNGQDETFKFNMMISVGLGFFLPTKPAISE